MGFFHRKKEVTTTSQSEKLEKARVELDQYFVSLEKETHVDLRKHVSRVFVVLDRSGSMNTLYRNGSIQDVLTRLLPLALRFDDNGELEVYVFDDECQKIGAMTLHNYQDFVNVEIMQKGYGPRGGTNYAPAIKMTSSDYNDGSPLPAFGMFITDGDCFDRSETNQAIRVSSEYKSFYQFIGTGHATFSYLEKLDNLNGRKVDNTAFIKVADFSKWTNEQLYAKLLEQYLQWLKEMNLQ